MGKYLTSDQVGGLVRALLTWGGGLAVASGYIDASTAAIVTGAVVTIAGALWSYYTNSPDAMIRAVNKADNGVKVVAEGAPVPVATTALR